MAHAFFLRPRASRCRKRAVCLFQIIPEHVPRRASEQNEKRDHIVFTEHWVILSLIFKNLRHKNRLKQAGFSDEVLKDL